MLLNANPVPGMSTKQENQCFVGNLIFKRKILKKRGRKYCQTSGQDGGVGRHTVPSCTPKRRTTTNLKTRNNQNYQKIELYGSPTTKELNTHSPRPVGGAEMDSQADRTCGKAATGGPGEAADWKVPHACSEKLGGTTGE